MIKKIKMEIQEKLAVNFDKFYKEYKEYKNFEDTYNKKEIDGMSKKIEDFLKTDPSELDTNTFSLDVKAKPKMFEYDIRKLIQRLLVAYEMVENLELEIPQEIKTEVESLKNFKELTIFVIKDSKENIVDQQTYDNITRMFNNPESLQELVKQVQKLSEMSAKKE